MSPIVDIHTHMYPASYVSLLKSRSSPPYIREDTSSTPPTLRLTILPSEATTSSTSSGRPLSADYYSVEKKLDFMNRHRISTSVISLANPWLDFLSPVEADIPNLARSLNDEFDALCESAPGKLFFFGVLPLRAANVEDVCSEVKRISTLAHCRGVVLSTMGLGSGLDSPRMQSVWDALSESRLHAFIHPHFGIPSELYGERNAENYGHILPLAVGFPVETTIAVARMLVGGVFDRHPDLNVILAHGGGTLPMLAGRLESCIQHDAFMMQQANKNQQDVWTVLRKHVYLDAVVYSSPAVKAAVDCVGVDRVFFGTDHPFFPPLPGRRMPAIHAGEKEEKLEWPSVMSNKKAISEALSEGDADKVFGRNAVQILCLS